MSSQPVIRISPEEYLALERAAEQKHDYVDGDVVAMAGGMLAHAWIAARVITELSNRLLDRNCYVVGSDARLCVSWQRLMTYPDVQVVCGEPQYVDDKRDTLLNPIVIVEVLSPSTAQYDRGHKAVLYRSLPSVREYLLVDQKPVYVEHYRRGEPGKWELTVTDSREAVIHLASLACDLPVRDIYRGVEPLLRE
jgi:Uma2 family endonuclease